MRKAAAAANKDVDAEGGTENKGDSASRKGGKNSKKVNPGWPERRRLRGSGERRMRQIDTRRGRRGGEIRARRVWRVRAWSRRGCDCGRGHRNSTYNAHLEEHPCDNERIRVVKLLKKTKKIVKIVCPVRCLQPWMEGMAQFDFTKMVEEEEGQPGKGVFYKPP
jgi:hypothetical protein